MFTGLIRELGVARNLTRSGNVFSLEIASAVISGDAVIGDSVSVNGACLTVARKKPGILAFDVMEETLRRTALVSIKSGVKVNLEDSIRAGGALGGHFVLGHVDCVGMAQKIGNNGGGHSIEIGFPQEFSHLVVEKGSVALDGISLTVGEVSRGSFKVYIIPHTLKMTNLGMMRDRDKVNIEFDIIGKYLARFRDLDKKGGVTEKFLRSAGF